MFRCIICRFALHLDDVAVPLGAGGRCVCLGCYGRQTDTARPMPKALRQYLTRALEQLDVPA
jgi:hypothetical protein